MSKTLEIESPCCASVRECWVRYKIVYSISQRKILQTINAVRCYRGYQKRYILELTDIEKDDMIIAEIYRSNRGRRYIYIEYKPQFMSVEHAERIIREYFNPPEEIEV